MQIVGETIARAPIERVRQAYTTRDDIVRWNASSSDWHTTRECRSSGRRASSSRMEAKEGSLGFNFAGTYTNVVPHQLIEYSVGDRVARVGFAHVPDGVRVRVSFDAAPSDSIDRQQAGWQAILNNLRVMLMGEASQAGSVATALGEGWKN